MVTYRRNTFYNPRNGEVYDWHINHSEEAQFGKTRQINNGANTGYAGLIMQQGDDEPMVLELSGTILHLAQHQAFVRWFAICRDQSIHFIDFAADRYVVIITAYNPVRQRTLSNPRDDSMRLHYYTYTLRMQVLEFIAGPWVGVSP